MADEFDLAQDHIDGTTAKNIDAIRQRASAIPEGIVGDCEHCGEYTPRLVNNACARCRDKYKLD